MADVTKRASLAEIRRMEEAGELYHDPAAPEGEDLGQEFWDQSASVRRRVVDLSAKC